MQVLKLPRLVGTREAVRDLMIDQGVSSSSLRAEPFVVLCRDLATGSTSFADELVKTVLEDGGAQALILVGAPDRFLNHVQSSAERRHVAGKVVVGSGAEVGV